MTRLKLFAAGLLLLSLSACGPATIVDEARPISEPGWAYADSLSFSADIQDTTKIYDIVLEVEHGTDYGFQNLYTRIGTTFPGGERQQQVLSLELADRAGVWQGKCNSKSCTTRIPLQTGAFFQQIGTHQFTFVQYMRTDTLAGIRGLRFRIEDTKQSKNDPI